MKNAINKIKNISKINYINYLILFYAFTLSFPGGFKRSITILILILWLSDKNRFKVEDKNIKTLITIFGIFIMFCFFSFFWSNATIIDALEYIKKYWYLLVIFPIYKYMKYENIKLALSAFLIGIFISEIFSYGNYFGIWEIGKGNQTNPTVFMHHVFYSIFLAVTSLILLIKILLNKTYKVKFLYSIFFITVTMNLLLNIGRTGQISLLITILLIIFIYYKLKLKYVFYTFGIIFTILILNYNFNSNFNNRINFIKSDINNIINENNYTTSLGGRIGFWILSKEILSTDLKNLIIGVGSKQNIPIAKEIVNTKYPEELSYNTRLNHFHSTYLSLITQFGIIGLGIFMFLIYKIVRIKIQNTEINLIKYTVIFIFLLSSIVDVPFYKDSSLGLFAFFVGLILASKKFEDDLYLNKFNINNIKD